MTTQFPSLAAFKTSSIKFAEEKWQLSKCRVEVGSDESMITFCFRSTEVTIFGPSYPPYIESDICHGLFELNVDWRDYKTKMDTFAALVTKAITFIEGKMVTDPYPFPTFNEACQVLADKWKEEEKKVRESSSLLRSLEDAYSSGAFIVPGC